LYVDDLTRLVRTKIIVCECGCWYWTGSTDSGGYSKFKLRGKTINVHRYAYERLVADIPEGLTIDHLACTSRRCCNPEHMQVVTRGENSERANATRWHDLKFDAEGNAHLHEQCQACFDRDHAPQLRDNAFPPPNGGTWFDSDAVDHAI
jgi:HNH endonuclease